MTRGRKRKNEPHPESFYNFPILSIENQKFCYTCGRELIKDETFQVLYASLCSYQIGKPNVRLSGRTHPFTELKTWRKVYDTNSGTMKHVWKMILVCELCCTEGFADNDVYSFGDGIRLPTGSDIMVDGITGEDSDPEEHRILYE